VVDRLAAVTTCANCGTRNPDGARFCLACGSSLVPACRVCGAEIPAEARFCPACGTPIAAEEEAPAGQERRLVTILFADVTDSTRLGERLDPERLQELMGTYFAAMREEIEAEGGTVEKFIGDAVMAAFGVPVAHEDDPARALRAALRMRRRLVEVNDDLQARFGVALEIRTGVNTGEVLAATNPGPGEPMVTGDAVNAAARLEQGAEPGQIVVAERTARAARGFRFRESVDRDLRGRKRPVPSVLLEGTAPAAPAAPERGVPGLQAPMVGRDSELEVLRSLYQRSVAERRPNLVTVYGDPGVGKSRLTREFVEAAETQEPAPVVVRGRCLPYGDGVTYWPLAEILKDLAGIRDTDPPQAALERVRALGADLISTDVATHPAKATAALAFSIGLEDPAFSFRDAEPREVRLKMHSAWRSLFSALARRSPVVAVIEDIHWADPALLDLLEELADRVVGPVVFVCPARPELTERRPDWGGGRRNVSSIALDPLTSEQSDQLIGFLLSIDDLPPSVHERILERAEGNPFFLEEIVRHLIDEESIVRDGDRWRAGSDIGDVEIPDTVQAVLAARIDLLEPVEKRALQRAAVVGRVFWPEPVGRLLNGDRDRLRETLDRLESRELVASRLTSSIAGEPEFIFKHVLTREVAYDSLPRRERATAHAAVASWIEDTAGGRSGEFTELLAYHYLEAFRAARTDDTAERTDELRRRAMSALLDVSREARSRFATRKAIASAERALGLAAEPPERIEAHEAVGLAARNDYRGDLSWRHLRAAIDLRLEHTPQDRRAIAWTCAMALENPLRWPGSMQDLPDPEEVRRYLDIGFAHIDDAAGEESIRLLTLRAFEPFGFGHRIRIGAEDRAGAYDSGIRAADLSQRLGRLDLESAALDGAGSAIIGEGLYGHPRFDKLIGRRLEIAEFLEDPWELGDIYAMAAWNKAMIGDYEESVRIGLIGRDRAEGAEGLASHCLNWVTVSLFHLGDWDRLLEVFAEIRNLLGERADEPPYFVMNGFGAAAFALDARGNLGAGHLLDILERSRKTIVLGSAAASYWRALAEARHGEVDRAWMVMHDAELEDEVGRPFLDEITAELLALTGRWDEVPAFLDASRAYAREAQLVALPVHLDRLEGRAAAAAGELESGLELLEAARDGFGRLAANWERARTELDMAEILVGSDRAGEARALVEAAAPDLERAGALLELERASDIGRRLG
jgi:class 3 adenylate cyclase